MAPPSRPALAWAESARSPEVYDAVERARSAVSALRRHPANRTGWPRTAAAASIRAARASAALDGAPMVLDRQSATVTDPVLAGAFRVAAAIGSLTAVWPRAPLQALARLHTLAAADLVSSQLLGRPGPTSPVVGGQLAAVGKLATASPWPAPVLVALVHGELLTVAPFGTADGVVARAAARLMMISTGFDPTGLGVPEVAHLRSALRYRDLAAGYRTGEPAAVTAWMVEICRCLTAGAAEGTSIADSGV